MSTSSCGKGSGSRFLIRHGFRQADYYNRLEPDSVIHVVRPDSGAQAIGSGPGTDCDDSSTSASASSGSRRLFLAPGLQACDTLLPSRQWHRKGTG